jgi:hypothetical protein
MQYNMKISPFMILTWKNLKLTRDMKLKKLCDPTPNHEWNGDHIVKRMVHKLKLITNIHEVMLTNVGAIKKKFSGGCMLLIREGDCLWD